MPTSIQQNWEGTILSYGSAMTSDFINAEMVEELMDQTDYAEPSTQPLNDNMFRRVSTQFGQCSYCGTDHRLPRPGQNQHHH